MYRTDKCAYEEKQYARAYIKPQQYENLFPCKEGFYKGTIFKDFYSPYKKKDKCSGVNIYG